MALKTALAPLTGLAGLATLATVSLVSLLPAVIGCSETQRPPRIEDDARKLAPIPACIQPLPSRSGQKGFVRQLEWWQYWQLTFPDRAPLFPPNATPPQDQQVQGETHWGFEKREEKDDRGDPVVGGVVHQNAVACTGRTVFDDPSLRAGADGGKWPLPVTEKDIVYGSGGNGIKVVWLITHRYSDGSMAGPIAVVRTKEDYAELYAVGAYKSQTDRPYFIVDRMGTDPVVTIEDDGCVGADVTAPCENTLTVLLPRKGELLNAATITLEQRSYTLKGEPGIYGRTEYKGTSTPKFVDGGIQVLEQVTVTDQAGRVVHKADRHRNLALQENNALKPDQPALFPQMFPKTYAH